MGEPLSFIGLGDGPEHDAEQLDAQVARLVGARHDAEAAG
jgi:hypothetical protein